MAAFTRRAAEITLALFLVLLVPFQLSMYHKHHPLHAVQHAAVARHEALHVPAMPPAPDSPPEDEARVEAVLACYDNPHHCASLKGNKNECYSNKTISQQLCKVSCDTCESLKQAIGSDMDVDVETRDSFVCTDDDGMCSEWAKKGWCDKHPIWMLSRCKSTCKFCQQDPNFGQDTALNWADYCGDDVDLCPYWAKRGSCSTYSWMAAVCRRSCKHCEGSTQVERLKRWSEVTELQMADECADFNAMCQRWAAQGMCGNNQRYMHQHCRLACGLCSLTPPSQEELAKAAADSERRTHLGAATFGVPLQHLPLPNCKDAQAVCDDWAQKGECDRNKGYMLTACKLSCGLCFTYWVKAAPRTLRLRNGRAMPTIGFGTAALGEGTQEAVRQALLAGYRHIDSAQAREWYREDLVGKALAQVPQVQRAQLFLTSKLHPRHHGYNKAKLMLQQSLTDLGTDYLDLFLLHYPNCWGDLCGGVQPEGTWQDSWRALEELHRAGKVRAIGVSNFDLEQMKELVAIAKVKPAVLQTHADPFNQNSALVNFCHEVGIVFTAYSTLGTQAGGRGSNPVMQDPAITAIAREVDRTVVQVVLRWAMQRGMVVIPRSASATHMRSNLAAHEFELPVMAMQRMMALDGVRPS